MSDETTTPDKQVKKHVLPKAMEKTKWVKGKSGNPLGRKPKEDTMSDCIREYLAGEVKTENGEKLTRTQILVRGMYKKAINGDPSMTRELLDRGFGKVAQKIETTKKESFYDMSEEEIDAYLTEYGIDPKSIK
jgi:hypothetical protein